MLDADGSTDPAEIPALPRPRCSRARTSPRARASCEGGGSADITPLRKLGNRVARTGSSTSCSGPTTPTSATATTRSGPSCLPTHRRQLRRLRGRDADQRPGRQGRPELSPRCRASSRSGSTASASCTRFATALRVLRTILSERFRPRARQRVTAAPSFRELERASSASSPFAELVDRPVEAGRVPSRRVTDRLPMASGP